MTNIYALYKGEDFIVDGTIKQIAEELCIKPHTVWFYKTPAYKKRGAKNENKRNRLELVLVNKNIKEKFRIKKK